MSLRFVTTSYRNFFEPRCRRALCSNCVARFNCHRAARLFKWLPYEQMVRVTGT